jgi:hypothetical protein
METTATQIQWIEAQAVETTIRVHLAAFARGDFDA